jgi:hypothetical protein
MQWIGRRRRSWSAVIRDEWITTDGTRLGEKRLFLGHLWPGKMGEILRMSENLIAVEQLISHEGTHGHFLWRRTREIMNYSVSDGSSLGDLPGLIYQTRGQTLDGDNTRCTILIFKTHPAFSKFAIRGLSMELDAWRDQAEKEVRKSRHPGTIVKWMWMKEVDGRGWRNALRNARFRSFSGIYTKIRNLAAYCCNDMVMMMIIWRVTILKYNVRKYNTLTLVAFAIIS